LWEKDQTWADSSMKLLCCTGGGDEEVGGRGEGEASRVV